MLIVNDTWAVSFGLLPIFLWVYVVGPLMAQGKAVFFEEEKVVVWINKGNFYSLQITINHLINKVIALKVV